MDGHTAIRERLLGAYRRVREATERLAAPLSAEDQGLQSMPACSPAKWHRAHTTWFFETFVLAPRGVAPFDARFALLFNSYYVALGDRIARPTRALLSRPSAADVGVYRAAVDARVLALLAGGDDATIAAIAPMIELGVAHEEQHQELLLTDILHAFSASPLAPAYRTGGPPAGAAPDVTGSGTTSLRYLPYAGGLVELGALPGGFHFDNEGPRHRVWLDPFELASRLVTVGEWRAFAQEGGYENASLWLSDGFDWVRANGVRAPLYVTHEPGRVTRFGFDGRRDVTDDEPITHVTFYEADALARFLGARLPTEQEWELAASGASPDDASWLESGALAALPARAGATPLFGDAWQWTSSSYAAYPGFSPGAGAIGEYNGKFMANQVVLRGGSCLTPRGHVRATYRNFWYPDTAHQMTGVRVARSLPC